MNGEARKQRRERKAHGLAAPYDADGERVVRTAGGVTTVFFEGVWEQTTAGARGWRAADAQNNAADAGDGNALLGKDAAAIGNGDVALANDDVALMNRAAAIGE